MLTKEKINKAMRELDKLDEVCSNGVLNTTEIMALDFLDEFISDLYDELGNNNIDEDWRNEE